LHFIFNYFAIKVLATATRNGFPIKMSFPTQPAFVVTAKGWDENMLRHPIMQFLHSHEQVFDGKKRDECRPYYCDDLVYQKSSGQVFHGEDAIRQSHDDYAMFAAHFHEPAFGIATETENGYQLAGFAKMYVNLPGDGERKYEDLQGRKWECVAEGGFLFEVVKDATGVLGMKCKSWKVFADPTPILSVALKKGIIPVEALMG